MHEDEGRINELNSELNSRTRYQAPEDSRRPIESGERDQVEDHWQAPELDEILRYERRKPEGSSLSKKLFLGALFFCLLAAAAAGFIYLKGGNFISSKNVDISVNGPTTLSAGETLDMAITITNRNNADLETADLSIEYPDGSRNPLDSTKSLEFEKTSLGPIGSGEALSTSTRAILFGEGGEVKTITLTLDYTVKGSKATFSKQKLYEVSIGASPVTMTIEPAPAVTSGQSFTTRVAITSNSTETLKNVVVRGEYPYGFSVVSSSPTALNSDGNLWSLGDMAPGQKKTISVTGILNGVDQEQRTFRFSSGVAAPGDAESFGTSLATASETINISRPQIGVSLTLGGTEDDPYAAPAGRLIQGSVAYQNNLPENLRQAELVLKLSGSALDKFSVSATNGGFYDSANNQIIWSPDTNPELASLSPGASGVFSFQFSSLANLPVSTTNQEVDLSATLSGTPEGAPSLTTRDTRTVKIGAQVSLSGTTLYSKGPFKNTGVIPPKAEQPTTYTLALMLKDTQNDITMSKLTASLAPGVVWLGQTSPAEENVSYNDTNRTVTWNVGMVASGTGFSSPSKTLYLQVSLSPSVGQIGSAPLLLQNIAFSGQDIFTNQPVNVSIPNLTTLISSDPSYVQGDEIVVK